VEEGVLVAERLTDCSDGGVMMPNDENENSQECEARAASQFWRVVVIY